MVVKDTNNIIQLKVPKARARKTNKATVAIKENTHTTIKKPKTRDHYTRDSHLSGYAIKTTIKGKKQYIVEGFLKHSSPRKKCYISIGECGIINEDEAREKAKKYLHSIKVLGEDPRPNERLEAQKKEAEKLSLMDLAEDYIKLRSIDNGMAEATQIDYPKRLRNQLGELAYKKIQDITATDWKNWWLAPSTTLPSKKTALRYAITLYNQAIALEYITTNHPANLRKRMKVKASPPKVSKLNRQELNLFISALKSLSAVHPKLADFKGEHKRWNHANDKTAIHETIRDYIFMLLISGKRANEIARLEWADINFPKGVKDDIGTIIIRNTKNNIDETLPMTDLMYEMLLYRSQSNTKHATYVFASPSTKTKDNIIKDIRVSLGKVIARMIEDNNKVIVHIKEGDDLTPEESLELAIAISKQEFIPDDIEIVQSISRHDLRRTFSSIAESAVEEGGAELDKEEIAILLHHVSNADVTEGYIGTRSKIKKHKLLDRVGKALIPPLSYNWIKLFWYGVKEGSGISEIDGTIEPANKKDWLIKIDDAYLEQNEIKNKDSYYNKDKEYI